ncbi:cytochrome P450 family protein [Ceratobasidium sp. AG-Ba]|nr:cytochrome P450 family protein [Ceratobasidium sp. AG-Ba]
MSRRYIERMSVRVSAGANNLVRLWTRKAGLVDNKAFAANQDLTLAMMDTMLSIVMGDSPSSVDLAYASLANSPVSSHTDKKVIIIPQSDPPSLQKAMRALTRSVEQLNFAPFPAYISKIFIQDLSPTWRKSRRIVSEFIDDRVWEARARENATSRTKHGESLSTDADCVVDMVAQREAREGAEKLDIGEVRDELMTFMT